jgi:hypothetical protein
MSFVVVFKTAVRKNKIEPVIEFSIVFDGNTSCNGILFLAKDFIQVKDSSFLSATSSASMQNPVENISGKRNRSASAEANLFSIFLKFSSLFFQAISKFSPVIVSIDIFRKFNAIYHFKIRFHKKFLIKI